jgi:hypothetical protein
MTPSVSTAYGLSLVGYAVPGALLALACLAVAARLTAKRKKKTKKVSGEALCWMAGLSVTGMIIYLALVSTIADIPASASRLLDNAGERAVSIDASLARVGNQSRILPSILDGQLASGQIETMRPAMGTGGNITLLLFQIGAIEAAAQGVRDRVSDTTALSDAVASLRTLLDQGRSDLAGARTSFDDYRGRANAYLMPVFWAGLGVMLLGPAVVWPYTWWFGASFGPAYVFAFYSVLVALILPVSVALTDMRTYTVQLEQDTFSPGGLPYACLHNENLLWAVSNGTTFAVADGIPFPSFGVADIPAGSALLAMTRALKAVQGVQDVLTYTLYPTLSDASDNARCGPGPGDTLHGAQRSLGSIALALQILSALFLLGAASVCVLSWRWGGGDTDEAVEYQSVSPLALAVAADKRAGRRNPDTTSSSVVE